MEVDIRPRVDAATIRILFDSIALALRVLNEHEAQAPRAPNTERYDTMKRHRTRTAAARRAQAFAALLAVAAMGACANADAEKAAGARTSLVGLPKERLLACAGVPDKSAAVDNLEYYTYTSREPRPSGGGVSVGLGGFGGTGGGLFGGGIGIPLSSSSAKTCEATFTLRNGLVEALTYGGNGSDGAPLGQCWRIVENCAPPG
jgi:hypothetical protein